MDQPSFAVSLARKELSARAIYEALVATVGTDTVGFSSPTRYFRQIHYLPCTDAPPCPDCTDAQSRRRCIIFAVCRIFCRTFKGHHELIKLNSDCGCCKHKEAEPGMEPPLLTSRRLFRDISIPEMERPIIQSRKLTLTIV
jgi:hypothetical protein